MILLKFLSVSGSKIFGEKRFVFNVENGNAAPPPKPVEEVKKIDTKEREEKTNFAVYKAEATAILNKAIESAKPVLDRTKPEDLDAKISEMVYMALHPIPDDIFKIMGSERYKRNPQHLASFEVNGRRANVFLGKKEKEDGPLLPEVHVDSYDKNNVPPALIEMADLWDPFKLAINSSIDDCLFKRKLTDPAKIELELNGRVTTEAKSRLIKFLTVGAGADYSPENHIATGQIPGTNTYIDVFIMKKMPGGNLIRVKSYTNTKPKE